MRIDMHIGMCIDMFIDICIDVCIDVYIDVCADIVGWIYTGSYHHTLTVQLTGLHRCPHFMAYYGL